MAYETRSQGTVGGLDWPRLIAIAFVCLFALPFVVLSGLFWLAWRRLNAEGRYGKRHVTGLFALSLLPWLVATAAGDNPLVGYFTTHGEGLRSAYLTVSGQTGDITVWDYLAHTIPALLPGSIIVACILTRLSAARQSELRRRDAVGVEVPKRVEKKLAKGVKHPDGGWALGYTPEGHQVEIGDEHARQHVIICGATGSGKTTVIRHLLDGVASRCPVVLVDCKGSQALKAAVATIPGSIVWEIGGDIQWDALRGDRTCVASKLLAAEPYSNNAGVYRAAAQRYLQWVGQLLELAGSPRDPQLIAQLLQPKALTRAVRKLADAYKAQGSPVPRALGEIEQLVANMGKTELEGVAGFASRFGVTVEGIAGAGIGAGPHALVLEDALRAGRTVLFSLDAAAYPLEAAKVGAWALLDLVRVAGELQAEGWGDEHHAYFVIDEFSALGYEGRHVVPVLARAREAGIGCVVATQGLADLAAINREVPQQVVQNAAVRILLRQGSHEDALAWARHGGEYEREEWNRHFDGMGEKSWSTRWRREFYVSPDELRVLGTGEAVVWIAPVGRAKRWIGRVRIAPPRPVPIVRRRPSPPLEIAFDFGPEPQDGHRAA